MSSRARTVSSAKRGAARAHARKSAVSQGKSKPMRSMRANRGPGSQRSSSAAVKPPAAIGTDVRDGVNTGMVWKNSNTVRDHFATRFEKVADLVTTTTAFDLIQDYYLNPGNSVLFPVFSQIAVTYEEYICHRLRFWYRGEEYTASGSNVTAGLLIYATNMDPDDATFTSTNQMENYEGSVSGPPFSGHFVHDVLEARHKRGKSKQGGGLALNQYFVYASGNQAAPSGQAAKFYDMGLFQVASVGTQTASPAGELWVEHSWTLIRRKQQTPIGQSNLYAHIVEGPAATAATATAYLGTTGGVVRAGSTIPTVATKTTFTLPLAGVYLVVGLFDSGCSSAATFTPGANIAGTAILIDSSSATLGNFAAAGNSFIIYIATVSGSGTAAANTMTIGACAGLASGTTDIFIVQVSGGIALNPPSRGPRPAGQDGLLEAGIASLLQRMKRLERGVVVTEPDTPPDDDDCKVVAINPLTQSVHIPASRLSELLGLGHRPK